MSNPSRWRERLSSPLTWHYAGLGLLIVVVAGLAIRVGMDWAETHGSANDELAGKQVQLRALEMETAPLRGLDKRVEESRGEMKEFYGQRIAPSYSSFSSRIGDLEVKSGVRLSRMLYTQGQQTGDLTEISLDAGISGDYPQIMRFVNGLERDQNFFVVRGMSLTGQQGGMVNLRLRVSTWMRTADAANLGLPPTQPQEEPANPTPATGKEGE
jgi:type IV pilus assembly protein PilO